MFKEYVPFFLSLLQSQHKVSGGQPQDLPSPLRFFLNLPCPLLRSKSSSLPMSSKPNTWASSQNPSSRRASHCLESTLWRNSNPTCRSLIDPLHMHRLSRSCIPLCLTGRSSPTARTWKLRYINIWVFVFRFAGNSVILS